MRDGTTCRIMNTQGSTARRCPACGCKKYRPVKSVSNRAFWYLVFVRICLSHLNQ